MNPINKVSDIKVEDIADYLRIDELTEGDKQTLNNLLGIAKTYIESYTGHTEAELDSYPDFAIVVYILCQDMWDNRTMYADSKDLNNTVQSILAMHSVNLL